MKILEFIKDMAKVSRWSQAHCHKNESTLEHTGAVVLIALKIATDFPEACLEKVLVRAAVHDMEETITGDIMTPVKYANSTITKAIKEFEDTSAKQVSQIFGEWSYKAWRDAKDDTLEGDIIKIADKAAVVYKFRHELALGNKGFEQYEENIWNGLYHIKCTTNHKQLIPYIHAFMDCLTGAKNEKQN